MCDVVRLSYSAVRCKQFNSDQSEIVFCRNHFYETEEIILRITVRKSWPTSDDRQSAFDNRKREIDYRQE